MAAEAGTSERSVRRIVKIDLGLKPLKKFKRHGLTTKNKEDRVKRCKVLLKRHGQKSVENLIFSDEKMWLLQESHNAQNDRIYAVSTREVPQQVRTVQRFQNSSAVMVWGGVSHNGKLPLIFIDKGVKINKEVYRKEILDGHLKVEAPRLYPRGDWIFQQDSAPAHKAKVTQAWCSANCPDFIKTSEWPPSSPDLNPLDYYVWGKLKRFFKTLKR
jgi:inhibitor of nuclear factor kappa-B kinase subunit alpha